MATISGTSNERQAWFCIPVPAGAACLTNKLGQEEQATNAAKWNAKDECAKDGKQLGEFEVKESQSEQDSLGKYWTRVNAWFSCKAPEKP